MLCNVTSLATFQDIYISSTHPAVTTTPKCLRILTNVRWKGGAGGAKWLSDWEPLTYLGKKTAEMWWECWVWSTGCFVLTQGQGAEAKAGCGLWVLSPHKTQIWNKGAAAAKPRDTMIGFSDHLSWWSHHNIYECQSLCCTPEIIWYACQLYFIFLIKKYLCYCPCHRNCDLIGLGWLSLLFGNKIHEPLT